MTLKTLWRRHVAWRFMPPRLAQAHLVRLRSRDENEKAMAKGLCPGCRTVSPRGGRRYCHACRAKRRQQDHARVARLKAEGSCTKCAKPNDRQGSECSTCVGKMRGRQRAMREARRARLRAGA